MHFTFAESAIKDLKKFPKAEQKRLQKKLFYWQGAADPLLFAKSLVQHQEATHRFRFAAYRIITKNHGKEIRILRIRYRKDVYK